MQNSVSGQKTLTNDLPVFVISLPQAIDRQARVAEQFGKIGLSYTLWDGVDGLRDFDKLMEVTDTRGWERNMGATVTAGHLGCYVAHVDLWRHLADLDADVALICEDDVTFGPDFVDALTAALDAPDAYDILRFSKLRAKFPILQKRLGSFSVFAYWGPFTGSACYLIRRDTASELSKRFYPIQRAHDHEMNRFFDHDFRLFGLEPFTAAPDDHDESFITGSAMATVRKFPKYQRLPHYMQKIGNYPRRLLWLIKHRRAKGK